MSVIGTHAFAIGETWNTTATDGNWVTTNSENNWSGGLGTFPGSTSVASSDVGTFLSSNVTSININSPSLSIGGITFGAASTALSSFTIGSTSGNSLFLASGGAIQLIADTSAGSNLTETVNAPLVLEGATSTTAGTYSFTNNNATASNVLNIGGAISGGTSSTVALTLSATNTGTNTVSGNISNGSSSALAVTKGGAGEWILSGNNTFTGGVSLGTNQGTLGLGSATALGNGGTFSIGNSVSLDNTSGADLTLTTNNPISLNGSFNFIGSHSLNLGNGAVTLTVNPGISVTANTLTFGGGLSGAHGFTKSGTGTLVIGGVSSFTGTVGISAGALNLQNSSALGSAGGSSSGLTVTTGAALQLQGGISTTTAVPITSLNGTGLSSKGAIENVSGDNTYTGAITLASASTIGSDAGTLTLSGGITNGAVLTTYTGSGNIVIGTTGISSGTGGLTKTGSGTLTLKTSNAYTGATAVNLGTLGLTSGSSLAATLITVGNATISSGVSGNAAFLVSGNASVGSTLSLANGDGTTTGQGTLSLVDGAANTFTINSGLNLGNNATSGGTSILDLEVGSSADEIAITAGKLAVKSGSTVTLNIVGLGGLSGTQQTLIAAGSGSSTNFALTNFNLVASGNMGGYTVGLANDGAGAEHLYLTEAANTSPIYAYYNGGAAASGGTTAFNSFTGGNTDTSNFSSDKGGSSNDNGLLGSTSNVFLAANNVTTAKSVTLGQDMTINSLNFTGTGSVSTPVATTIGAGNTLTIAATGTYTDGQTSPVTYAAGTGIVMQPGAAASTINAPIVLGNSQTWEIDNAANKPLTVTGQISGTGKSLTKTGTGSLIETANNTYTGGTTLSGGTTYVNNLGGASYTAPTTSATRPITATNSGSGTGTGSVTVNSGSTLAGSGTIASTSGGVTVKSGGTLASGSSQTAFAIANGGNGSGNGSVNGTGIGGGLTINNSSNLSSALTVNGGATLTFALGSSTAYNGGSGALNFANPNTNSTYLSIAGNTADQIFSSSATADTIKLVDLTNGAGAGGVALTLRAQNPYLLIQTALGDNSDFTNLWTTGGEGQNGYVLGLSTGVGNNYLAFNLGAYDINGNLISSTSNLQGLRLYLYNGDLEVVPEPGTWALMLGGLALLVFVQRRKARVS